MPDDTASVLQNKTAVNGFLNFYKPVGMTSMEALRRVKRITGQRKKVGHAGTLDPLAEGVLPVCFGQATRLMEQVVSGWKRYRMTVRLGAVSNTFDAEGEITEVCDSVGLGRAEIAAELSCFVGTVEQVPPMYSAIKVGGRRLYELARAGKDVDRPPRQVSVRSIAIEKICVPYLELTVECGRGTYLRSIAHDLGQALGCGGYVTQLSRISCGDFRTDDSVTLEDLELAQTDDAWRRLLHPVDWAMLDLPPITLGQSDAWSVKHGQAIGGSCGADEGDTGATNTGSQLRAYDSEGVFLALLRQEPDGMLQPVRVFDCVDPSPYACRPGRS